jgi:hypothetical protein
MEILVESAVRATVLAGAVGLVVTALRLASPRTLHTAWTGVAFVMLLSPAIVAWGPEAAIPVLWSAPASAVQGWDSGPVLDHGVAAAAPLPSIPHQRRVDWKSVIALIYAGGLVLLLLRLGLGVWRACALIGEAAVVRGRLTHPRCMTPMTVGLFTPVVILPRDWPRWTDAELAAVLTHEEAHVRRRDPLLAFLTLANRAVFWFHPLAWWLQRRVANLSEQACDEMVILQGHDTRAYSASLLRFARAVADDGRRVVFVGTGMPGTNLHARLRLLTHSPTPRPSVRGLACLSVAYLGAVAISSAATLTPPLDPADPAAAQAGPRADQVPGGEWRVESSEHFEIFYEQQQAGRLEEVKRHAEDAYAQVSGRLKYDLVERVPLILVRRNGDLSGAGAPALEVMARSGALSQQRIVISTEALDTRAGILVHELTHQFAFEIIPRAGAAAPGLVEGLAEHQRGLWDTADYRRLHDDVAAGRVPDLDGLPSSERRWGHALFDFVAAEYAAEGVRRFLFVLRTQPQPGNAVPLAFGVPFDDFSQAFRAYVETRFGGR